MDKTIQDLGGTARNKQYDKWKESKRVIDLNKEVVVLLANCKRKSDNNTTLQSKRSKVKDELNRGKQKLKIFKKQVDIIISKNQALQI